MTHKELQIVFSYLIRFHEDEQSQDWYTPYNRMPDFGLTTDQEVTQEMWEAYIWETSDHNLLPEGVEQTNFASPKPSWTVLMNHLAPALRNQCVQGLKEEHGKRWTALHTGEDGSIFTWCGGEGIDNETLPPVMLNAKFRELREQIEEDLTKEQLQSLDVTDDALWSST